MPALVDASLKRVVADVSKRVTDDQLATCVAELSAVEMHARNDGAYGFVATGAEEKGEKDENPHGLHKENPQGEGQKPHGGRSILTHPLGVG